MPRPGPRCSIVIPTYRRPTPLARCLEALSAAAYRHGELEVLVVDDGGGECLEAVVRPWRERLDVRLLEQRNAGPAAARNHGASHARGEILAFTDDDCLPEPEWLRGLETRLARQPEALVGGRTLNSLRDNPYSAASQLVVDFLYRVWNEPPDDAVFFTSNNMAMTARAFQASGGFDPAFPLAAAEDRDFCSRWRERGGRLVYVPEARLAHAHGYTGRGFWRQHFGYGRGAWQFHRKSRERAGGTARPDPRLALPGFHWRLLLYAAHVAPPTRLPSLAALILVSQAAHALGFYRERLAGR